MSGIVPYLWYPSAMAGAIAGFALLLAIGVAPAIAAYLPIIAVASLILLLERWNPERTAWRPTGADVKADAAYMVVVQIALARALAATALIVLATWTHDHWHSAWWPQTWPLALQILLMVLTVDLMRYWLHRACHRNPALWRLHEVHHSPEVLYALNVGRFHPLEKILHFSLDTVPFLLLGVRPEVIAGYFLLYSVNGFFQHSNLRLRYGWLNYVVGSAETHRWHHGLDPATASCNLGNTTIIWDLVFGTWFLPQGDPVDDIGIVDRGYPKSFAAQMAAPFRKRNAAAG